MKRAQSPPLFDTETRRLKRWEKEQRSLMRAEIWPRPLDREEDVLELLVKKSTYAWFALKMILAYHDVPIEVGSIVMLFMGTYKCIGCPDHVLPHLNSSYVVCLTCYNLQNGEFGLMCRDCRLFCEKCLYCDYTTCDVHLSSTSHCHSCDSYLCNHCAVHNKAEYGLCNSCYFQ